ncbi:GNAT family N-acetyltransferase [Streptomyces sp. NPDC048564]|uniref:GNAT family N-acetyltransferase n=1 Tax=Streptomyces sp. NPDC048564 TaxID=3155760 RepID=UPI00342A8661
MTSPVWITSTPPTPNGDLHVGHLAGPYVAGDVLSRFLRSESRSVLYTSGIDDHQSYVQVRGLKEGGKAPEDIADAYGASIERTWRSAAVSFDRVVLPRRDPGYDRVVQRFFQRLHDDGHIEARTTPLPYCASCELWLYEAYVVGGCPHCGSSSNGNACEACGRPNDCGDLVDPRCTLCGQAAESRPCERLYFPLGPHTERLVDYWATVRMPPHLRALCERMAAEGLPDIAVTHPADWGVGVPVPGFEDQRIYVWFEMAPGYLMQAGRVGGADGAGPQGPVQFFGFDNGYFHAVLFPALYAACGRTDILPAAFEVNEFYRLREQKFSTSRRHAVWADEVIEECGSDVLRHHVCCDRPEGRQTSFDRPALERTRRHLDTLWNGWLDRLFDDVEAGCGGRVPDEEPVGADWESLRSRLLASLAELREAYGPTAFAPRRAVALLDEMVRCVTDFAHVQAHQAQRPGGAAHFRAALAAQLAVASALAAWAAPLLPVGAARLAQVLGVPAGRPVTAAALAVPRGRRLTLPDGPVFGSTPHYTAVGDAGDEPADCGGELTTDDVRVRAAAPADLPELAELFRLYLAFYGVEPDGGEGPEAFLTDRLKNGDAVLLLAETEGGSVGFAQVYPTFSSLAMKPVWTLNDLYVRAGARGAGAGRALVRACVERARAAGATGVQLETGPDNRVAQALYEAEGFSRGEYLTYFRAVDTGVDASG